MQIASNNMAIVSGYAIKDAELKHVGAKDSALCEFCLNVGKRKDTTTIFANCKIWYENAHYAANIQKGDMVLAAGRLESREYNGKTYTDLICDYVDFVPKPAEGCNGEGEQVKSEGEIRSALAIPGEPINDGDLPF